MKNLYTSFIVLFLLIASSPVTAGYVIALDAGHGGKDSGAVGQNSLYEKTVTFSITKKVEALLKKDKQFTPVLTRNSDVFISVSSRSDIARKKKAHLLISIHADSAPNKNAYGASVWVLSNKRADTELGRWLEQREKQSELLGGAGNALAKEKNPYLSQAVLDLQFAYAQRVGYQLAQDILEQMGRVTNLHKKTPEHASLGVLRSPDIPSVLIEVGFISNKGEEKLLGTDAHQNKIANAIYQGIKRYVQQHPL